LLQQLRSSLMPLLAESAEPELVAESLQQLFDWIARERERAAAAPRSDGVEPQKHRALSAANEMDVGGRIRWRREALQA